MTDGKRLLMTTLMYGSVWGLLECTVGALLHLAYLPAGAVMVSIALALMVYTRCVYGVKGMQLGMGLVAGSFKLLNLGFVGGCVWCAVVAIVSEGLLFELMYGFPQILEWGQRRRLLSGIVTGYVVYVGGYVLAESVTPLFFAAGLHLPDVSALLPIMLGRGVLAAAISGVAYPLSITAGSRRLFEVGKWFYPVSSAVTLLSYAIATSV